MQARQTRAALTHIRPLVVATVLNSCGSSQVSSPASRCLQANLYKHALPRVVFQASRAQSRLNFVNPMTLEPCPTIHLGVYDKK